MMLNNIYTVDKLVENVKNNYSDKEIYFGEWLDDFYRVSNSVKQIMVDTEPNYLTENKMFMVYIAASVEYLTNTYSLNKPKWVDNEKYYSSVEYFAFDTTINEYQDYLRKTSPIEFSKRNLFVGENVLKRV